MIIPVRCPTCGKVIGHKWDQYKERTEDGEDPKKVLDDLGVEKYCCRSVFLGHVDILEDVAKYKKL